MTFKPIRYSDHAAKMLRIRRIGRADIRWLIARGDIAEGHSSSPSGKRWTADGKIGKRRLRVVFIERRKEIEVVTVMIIS